MDVQDAELEKQIQESEIENQATLDDLDEMFGTAQVRQRKQDRRQNSSVQQRIVDSLKIDEDVYKKMQHKFRPQSYCEEISDDTQPDDEPMPKSEDLDKLTEYRNKYDEK